MDKDRPSPTPAAQKAAANFLVACARYSLDQSQLDDVRQKAQAAGWDWQVVRQMAEEHGVLPLLHKAVQNVSLPPVPQEKLNELNIIALSNVRRNFVMMSELLKLLGKMHVQQVRALPYKGPVLAMTAYGDLSMRQAGDLDILVPQADLARARAILDASGYQCTDNLTPSQEEAHLASAIEYNFCYMKPEGQILVELHWQVAGKLFSFSPDPVDLWNRAEPRTVGGVPVRALCPEDCLLVLSAHGMKHFWTRLTWICDIAQYVKANPSIHWRKLLKRSSALDARNMTLLGLVLAHRVLKAAVPQFVLAQAGSKIHAQAAELEHRLFLPLQDRDQLPRGGRAQLIDGGLFSSLLFHYRTRENWASGLRYCFHRIMTPSVVDTGWMKLPQSLSFLYYVLRPMRLAMKYGPLRFMRSGHRNPADVMPPSNQ